MTAPTKNKRDLFKEPGLYDSIRLPEASPERPYVAINMVMTADGAISPPDHSYRHISGPEDQRTYRRMRIHFDAIMRGTKTLDIDLDRNLMNAHIVNARAQIGLPNPPFVVILPNTGNVDPNSLIFPPTPHFQFFDKNYQNYYVYLLQKWVMKKILQSRPKMYQKQ